jgi:hypothetical protein
MNFHCVSVTEFCHKEYNLVMHPNSVVLRVHCTWVMKTGLQKVTTELCMFIYQ